MSAFDRWFIHPDDDELIDALAQAARAVNRGSRVGKLAPDADAYRAFLSEEGREGEGAHFWQPEESSRTRGRSTLIGLAWWTDWLGRRHARVVGRRVGDHGKHDAHPFKLSGDLPPPLWMIYPDHHCVRTLPGRGRELLAICDCGAVGLPEELAWMGTCCGPCHDREAEDASPSRRLPGLVWHRCSGEIVALHFAASGSSLAVVSGDGRETHVDLRAWPSAARRLEAHAPRFLSQGLVPFAANGRLAALDGADSFTVWDLERGEVKEDLPRGYQFRSLAVSGDGQLLAGLADKALHLVDAAHPAESCGAIERDVFLEAHPLAFAPDNRSLAVGTAGACVYLVEPHTLQTTGIHCDPIAAVTGQRSAHTRCLAFSPDGRRLAAGRGSSLDFPEEESPDVPGVVCLWAAGEERPRVRLAAHRGSVNAVAFSPEGRCLVSAGADGMIRLWDAETGREKAGLEWHVGAVRALTFSPDGEFLLSGGADGAVRVWPLSQLLPVEQRCGEAVRA